MANLNMPGGVGGHPPVQPMMPGRDTGGLIRKIVLVIVLLLLCGGGYYGYTLYKAGKIQIPFIGKKDAQTLPPTEVIPPPDQAMEIPPEASTATPTTTPAPTPPPKSNLEVKPETVPPSAMQPMGKGDFTVVVGSYQSKKAAEEEAARWSNAGYQGTVTEKYVGGGAWYRVSLGRYETRKMALKAAKEMKSKLEGGYWVDRVR